MDGTVVLLLLSFNFKFKYLNLRFNPILFQKAYVLIPIHQGAHNLDLDIRSAQISNGLPFYFDRSTGSLLIWITWCYHLIGNPFFIDSLASPTVTSYSFSERKDSTRAIQQAGREEGSCTIDFF